MRLLTQRPLPRPNESTLGYFHRLAARNGYSDLRPLAASVAANDASYLPEGSLLPVLENLTGHSLGQMDVLPLRKVGVGAAGNYFWNDIPLHRKHIVKGLHVCPECLREQAFHKATWQLIWMPLCEVHKCPLVSCGPQVDSAMFIKALKGGSIWPRRRWTDHLSPVQLHRVIGMQQSLMQGILSWDQDLGFRYNRECGYVDRLIDRMQAPYTGPRAGELNLRSTESPERAIEYMLQASF